MRGPWWGIAEPDACVSVLQGMREARPDADITYAQGVSIEGDDVSGIASAVDAAVMPTIILCVGERAVMSGEAASRWISGCQGASASSPMPCWRLASR